MKKQMFKKKFSLLAVFAHPDDESITMGGTLAHYARRGVEVHLLSATRGEWGTISDSSLAARENLAAVREAELRRACRILGVNFQGFLDCPDGKVNHTVWHQVENKIVRHIRKLRPQIVVTFGPDGLYWNSDHIAIGDITTDAFVSAADPNCFPEHLEEGLNIFQAAKLYYAQYPDFLMRELAESLGTESDAPQFWGFEPDNFGVPIENITTILDVRQTLSEKIQAIQSHQTQLCRQNIFSLVNEENAARLLSKEYFRRVFPINPLDKIENDLFETVSADNREKNESETNSLFRHREKIERILEKHSGVRL